jgi:hypothetical protein
MFGVSRKTFGAVALMVAYAACGGGDLDVYNNQFDDGTNTPAARDAGSTTDTGSDPNNVAPTTDSGSSMPDLPRLDMMAPNPEPTTNVPQQGPSVGEQVTSSCSTISVKGLSSQLIDQMNCLDPGVMKSFDGAPGLSYGAAVFPFQQGPATDVLTSIAANNPGTMPVSSALRTVPQQYLLYQWYQRSLCNANLAASPGRSNHNGGLAIDIGDSSVWRTPMRNESYIDNVSGEPWHFFFSGAGGKDVRNLSVLAFQKLYNYNFPENPIDEDGAYGPMTEGAMVNSPANGFTAQPRCDATMLFIAYPNSVPLDVWWEHLGDGLLGIRTIAPAGIQLVEYYANGKLVGYADHDEQWFETVLTLPRGSGDFLDLEAIAYGPRGEIRGRADGLLDVDEETPLFVRPLGGGNYELGLERVPNGVRSVEYFVDGIPVEQDRRLKISRDPKRLATQLTGSEELDIVLLDRKERVVEIRTRRFP